MVVSQNSPAEYVAECHEEKNAEKSLPINIAAVINVRCII
jgi:hypothetical protein